MLSPPGGATQFSSSRGNTFTVSAPIGRILRGRIMTRHLRIIAIALVLSTWLATSSHGGGFYVPQQTTEGLGRAFAGDAAAADDASTVAANPAGMTELARPQIDAGLTTIVPSISFSNSGSTAATPGTAGVPTAYLGNNGGQPAHAIPVPYAYWVTPLVDHSLWFGVGLNAPYGLTLKYDHDWFGRYDTLDATLLTIDLTPGLAYRVDDWLSLGATINFQYADAKLSSALPNTLLPGGPTPATDGLSTLRGRGVAIGGDVGILLKPVPGTQLGLNYRSRMHSTLGGSIHTQGLTGPLAVLNGQPAVSTDLDFPDVVTAGLVHRLTPRLTLLAGAQFFSWSRFREVRVNFGDMPPVVLPQRYANSYTASIGVEYELGDNWRIRSGFQFDETPTVDQSRNTTVPDGNRYWAAMGLTWRVSDAWSLEAAYAHVFFETAEINLVRSFYPGTPAAGTVVISGRGNTQINTFAFAVKRRF
jgi:long-chain fatty acid transport protein